MGMVRKFCYTTDRQVMARHMEPVNGLDGPGQDYLARTLLPYAHRAWDDICSPAGRLRFEHDHYMNLWAMTSPQLGADFVLLDEARYWRRSSSPRTRSGCVSGIRPSRSTAGVTRAM